MPVPHAISISRADLYDRVWAEPVQQVARSLGISDVGLAKACRRHQIPIPPRGYWRRKETGHKVRQTPLPRLSDSKADSALVKFWPPPTTLSQPSPEPPEDLHPLIAFERAPENTLVVPDVVHKYHSLIRDTQHYWLALKRGEVNHANNRLPHLNIRVSNTARPRALRLLHTLLTALDERGFQSNATPEGKTIVTILEVKLELSLRERLRQVRHEPTPKELADAKRYSWMAPPTFDQVDSGDLDLALENTWGTRHLWRDGKRQRLEQLLNDVIEGLVAAALLELERRAERERQRQAEEESQRRREEEKRLHLQEQARVRHLEALMAAADHHVRLRRFVRRLRPLLADRPELGDWLTWATEYAERHNPLERWRNPQPAITLYHPVHSYETQPIIANGFRDQARSSDDEQAPSVFLADVPVTRNHTSTCVEVTLPETAVLSFEELPQERGFRCFHVPAALLNAFPRAASKT